jgi:hypothetical protein
MQDAELMQCVCDAIIRMIRWVEDVARMGRGRGRGKKKNAQTVLVGKFEEATCKT